LDAVATGAFAFGVGWACVASLCHTIDGAVAIVIFSVACFGFGEKFSVAGAPLPELVTRLGAGHTGSLADIAAFAIGFAACATAVAFAAFAGDALATFVDLSIAIVVFAITGFWLLADLSYADREATVGAAAFTCCTGTFATESAFAVWFAAFVCCGVAIFFVVVDLTIAVVIDFVAQLADGGDFALTCGPCAILADFVAAFAAPCTGVIACCIFFAAGEAVIAFSREFFVDGTVTVVVFSITNFGGGFDFADASGPLSGFTSACTRAAESFVFGAGCAGVAAFGEAVYIAITIVVLAVAGFFLWCDFALAVRPFALCGTNLLAFFAVADAFGLCGATVAGTGGTWGALASVVYCAIAIIVGIVANFCLGCDFADALAPLSFDALLASATADALSLCAAWSCVASLDTDAIIDGAVAIVVLPIANFFAGEDLFFAVAPGASVVAKLDACAAGSSTLGAWRATVTGLAFSWLATIAAFVDVAITVIVLSVSTDFVFGKDLAGAYAPASVAAALETGLANPQTECGWGTGVAATGWDIIDFAVAIVVECITCFGLGGDVVLTGTPLLACATLDACATASLIECPLWSWIALPLAAICTRTVVVHLTIAIIVEVVAGLGGGEDFSLTGGPDAIFTGLGSWFTGPGACCAVWP
jgi:hypothetical protein